MFTLAEGVEGEGEAGEGEEDGVEAARGGVLVSAVHQQGGPVRAPWRSCSSRPAGASGASGASGRQRATVVAGEQVQLGGPAAARATDRLRPLFSALSPRPGAA